MGLCLKLLKIFFIKRVKYGRHYWAGQIVRMLEERIARIIFSRESGRGQ